MENEYVVSFNLPANKSGGQRKVTMCRVNLLDFIGKQASLEFKVENFNADGSELNDPDIIRERTVTIPISNTDRVIDGMLIEQDDERYESAVPEFDWWMSMAIQYPLITIIQQGTQLLIETGRFDRV